MLRSRNIALDRISFFNVLAGALLRDARPIPLWHEQFHVCFCSLGRTTAACRVPRPWQTAGAKRLALSETASRAQFKVAWPKSLQEILLIVDLCSRFALHLWILFVLKLAKQPWGQENQRCGASEFFIQFGASPLPIRASLNFLVTPTEPVWAWLRAKNLHASPESRGAHRKVEKCSETEFA